MVFLLKTRLLMSPFFSIVIPLFNKENYIQATIKSVLNQSFTDFELIIINDGSTDKSFNLVKSIKDTRIKLFSNKNKGLSHSRNYGVKKAKANYIAFLDADDLWMEDFLQTMFELITKNKNYKIFATQINLLKPNGKAVLRSKTTKKVCQKTISNYLDLTKFNITPSALVVCKTIFNNVGYFNEAINYAEDEDFYIRCFADNDLIFYQDPKIYYRVGFEKQLTTPNTKFKKIIPKFCDYLNNENKTDLKPYLDFIHYKLVVLFKMEKNYELVKFYKNKIDKSNLSIIQKIKYHLPTIAFYNIKSTYIWFSNTFIHS